MLKGENYWSWERAMEHAEFLLERYPHRRFRVFKTASPALGWAVADAYPRKG